MAAGTAQIDVLHEAIARRAYAGESLEAIDAEVVREAPLDEDRRSALWLYAWSRTQFPARRPIRSPGLFGG